MATRSDGDETIIACPHCDSGRVQIASTHGDADGRYHCKDCGRHTDDPVRRERKHGGHEPKHGLARELYLRGRAE